MEVTKYYTPNIEEFHIGFEYYRLEPYLGTYDLCEVTEDFSYRHYNKYSEEFFVKYLTKEDIESLGFKYIKAGDLLQNNNIYTVDKYEYGVYSSGDNYSILTSYPLENAYRIESNVSWIGDPSNIFTVFDGYIKNKSELIRLLKQLGIND